MLARCKELIPLVDGGDVRSVHDGIFLHQAQPAADGGGVEVGVGGQRHPRDVEGTVGVLKSPDIQHFSTYRSTRDICRIMGTIFVPL